MTSKINRELDNYFAIVHDLASGADSWSARPAWLEFSPNNLCNLRCVMCGQADGVPLEVMPKEEAEQLLDSVLPSVSLWTPSALSEPMLANIRMVADKCRQHEVFLNMYSNATVLNGERLRKIADRIHKLWISFDSPVPEVFEALRVRAKFDEVCDNVREILQVANELAVPIGFVSVLMKQTVAHLPDLIDLLADLGAAGTGAELRLQPMVGEASGCADSYVFDHYSDDQICAYLDRTCDRAHARGMNFYSFMEEPFRRIAAPVPPRVRGIIPDILVKLVETIRERYPHFCYMSAIHLKVKPDGNVYPCCVAPEELCMGNTKQQSIEEIWNGDKYRAFRRRMQARDYPEPCKSCNHLVGNPHYRPAESTATAPCPR